MKYLFLFIMLLPSITKAQRIDDTKIIITVTDSVDLYKKTKIALVNHNFIVKDNYNYETLTTYESEMHSFPGYMIAGATIKGNTVTLYGTYGLKPIGVIDYTLNNVNYIPVAYYKGSYSWRVLISIAQNIGSQIAFSK